MPKFSTSTRHASYNDAKKIKKAKHRDHQYRDAAKARKLRQTGIKGIVEEVIEPVEQGKPRPLRRGPKYDLARIERKLRARCDESQPLNNLTTPTEVYGSNPVNFNVPRVIVPTSEATAKRKQAVAGDDDGDTTDVDDTDDAVVVPAGFVEAAENLGLLSAPTISGPREELEKPPSAPHVQLAEKAPVAECLPIKTETPPPPPAVPQSISSMPPPTQPSQGVPVEAGYDGSQIAAATNSSICFESSDDPSISVPQVSVPESFPGAACPVPQYQNSTFCNTNDVQAFNFHQQGIQNASYLGSNSDDDVDMEFSGVTTTEPPAYCLPAMWASPQPQSEHQMFYSHVCQVANSSNRYQTYTTDNVHPGAAMQFQPLQSEPVQQFTQINQPPFNHLVEPLAAASHFWEALSESSGTSQSPNTSVAEVMKSTPTHGEARPQEEPSDVSSSTHGSIRQSKCQDLRRYQADHDGIYHPFPNLRGWKNKRFIEMNGGMELRVIQPMPGYRRSKCSSPVGSEIDVVNHLRMGSGGHKTPLISKTEHGKRRREDAQSDSAHTGLETPPRQRQRCEPDAPKLKTPVLTQKRKRKVHRQREASLKGPSPTSSQAPTGWSFSRFCPSVSSLADRLFKLF